MPIERLAGIDANLKKLAQLTASMPAAATANDERIAKLVQAVESGQQEWEQLRRERHAYLTTIHPRH